MNFKTHKDMQDEMDKVKEQADYVVKKVIPQRIVELKTILESPDFSDITSQMATLKISMKKDPQIYQKPKVLPSEFETVPVNSQIERMIDVLHPFSYKMDLDLGVLDLWLHLLVPKAADGNNFGVEVQLGILNEIENMRQHARGFNYQPSGISADRAKTIKLSLKYPAVEDYKQIIIREDQGTLMMLRQRCWSFYSNYLRVYDLIMKNNDKLVKPRPSTAENLY